MEDKSLKRCLSIAGSDCGGGAGIQADIKTFSALGCFGMSVVTSVVAESPKRVISRIDMPAKIVSEQMDAVFQDMGADAVKTGMLPNEEIIAAVAEGLRKYKPKVIISDPVMVATSGGGLMDKSAKELYVKEIFPISTLITPNIPEAEEFTGMKIESVDDMKKAAVILYEMGAKNVLIKGGHLKTPEVTDVIYTKKEFYSLVGKRIDSNALHGTGCTLSSAAAAWALRTNSIFRIVDEATAFVRGSIMNGFEEIGSLNHFHKGVKG